MRWHRPRANARNRRRCRSASLTATHGQAVPGSRAGRRRARADGWRRNAGARVASPMSGNPSAPRSRAITNCTIRGDSGPPLAPTNSGPSGGRSYGQIATYWAISCSTCGNTGTMRDLLPFPVTTRTPPGAAASRRRSPSASAMRRPDPYNSASTAASRASIQGSRSSPARTSTSLTRLASATASGLGKVRATFGARTAASAPTLPLPLRSRKRANDRTPANVRMSERLAMPSARRAAMNARTSAGESFARRPNVTRAPKCSDMKRRNCRTSRP